MRTDESQVPKKHPPGFSFFRVIVVVLLGLFCEEVFFP